MKITTFVLECEELGAVRPPTEQILQFHFMRFKDSRDAKAASELLHEIEPAARFHILDNIDHAMLQYANPDSMY